MVSVLADALAFLDRLGVYDVVLPFLLIFTIVFALLEKSRVLGVEKVGADTYSRKNLNSLVAFVIAFLSLASARLVEAITTISSHFVVVLLLAVLFLTLVGSFYTHEDWENNELGNWVKWPAVVIMFISIVFIALDAIRTEAGDTWLDVFWGWLTDFWTSPAIAATVLIIGVIIFMFYITYEPKRGTT